jgi:hypothetical protein
MAKKQISLHDFMIAKIRSASQKWPETYAVKNRVRVEVRIEYDKTKPTQFTVHVPETVCTLADGTKFTVFKQILIRPAYKPAQNRNRVMYLCECCKCLFFEKDWIKDSKGKLVEKVMIAIDHIAPIVDPNTGFVDWNTYFARMFPGDSGLQVLCNYPGEMNSEFSCHRKKTTLEKGIAAERVRKEKGLPPKKPKKERRR